MHQCQKLQFLQQPLEVGSKSEISAMDYLVKKHVYSLGNKMLLHYYGCSQQRWL